jgi:hypothetical protein
LWKKYIYLTLSHHCYKSQAWRRSTTHKGDGKFRHPHRDRSEKSVINIDRGPLNLCDWQNFLSPLLLCHVWFFKQNLFISKNTKTFYRLFHVHSMKNSAIHIDRAACSISDGFFQSIYRMTEFAATVMLWTTASRLAFVTWYKSFFGPKWEPIYYLLQAPIVCIFT